jgi:hypothetical protein
MPFAILAVRAHSPAVTEAIRTKIGQLSGKEFTRPMYRKNIDEVEYIETPRVGVLLASRQRKMRTMQGKAQNPLKVRHRHRSEHHLPGELRHHTVHHKGGKREVLAFRDTPDGEPVQKQPDKEAFEEVSMDDEEHGET